MRRSVFKIRVDIEDTNRYLGAIRSAMVSMNCEGITYPEFHGRCKVLRANRWEAVNRLEQLEAELHAREAR